MELFTLQRKILPPALLIFLVLLATSTSSNGQAVVWDTVSTGKVRLAVSNHGSMGLNGIGGANMDFTALGGDCDSTADVYLYSGGLFVLQEIEAGVDYRLNTGLYQDSVLSPVSFIPDPSGPPSSHFVGPEGSDAFFTGRFVNHDSTIGFERTYYAPTTELPYENVTFIVVRTDLFALDSLAHGPLAIGEVLDWDIPSHVTAYNTSGSYGMIVYLQGTDTLTGCQSGMGRSGASVLLGQNLASEINARKCVNNMEYWGIYAAPVDSGLANATQGGMDPAEAWQTNLARTGEWTNDDTTNQQIVQTFRHGFWLQPSDTLTAYTALVAVKDDSAFRVEYPAGLACDWYEHNLRPGCDYVCSCCKGNVGNFDGDPYGMIDLGDLTAFIDYLFISFTPPYCYEAADINYDCVIDLGDLTAIIDYLFISCWPPPPCPSPFSTPCDWPPHR